MLGAAERLPVLNEIGIQTLINGPIPVSADGEPVMGLAPELDNFFVACGFTAGIAASGGAGEAMAQLDPRRRSRAWTSGRSTSAASRAPGQPALSRRAQLGSLRRLLFDPLAGGGACKRARRAAQPALRRAEGEGRRLRLEGRLGAADLVRHAATCAGSETPSFEAEAQLVRCRRARAPGGARARGAVRPDLVLQVRGARARRARGAAADRRRRPRPAGRQLRLHAALQRARRHRGRPHHHAAGGGPLLCRDRQPVRRARFDTGSGGTCRRTARWRSPT